MNEIKFDRWGNNVEMETKDFYNIFPEHFKSHKDWYKMGDAERAIFEYVLKRQDKYLSTLDLSKGFQDFYNNGILRIIKEAAIDFCLENNIVKSIEEYNKRYVQGGYKTFYNYGTERLRVCLNTLAYIYGGWEVETDFWANYEKAQHGEIEQVYLPFNNIYVRRAKRIA